MHGPSLFVARLLVALVAAFGCTGVETRQETAKSVAQETAASLEISTSKGPVAITGVELSDRVPPKCQTGDCFLVAKEGYKYLIIWLSPKPNTKRGFWSQQGKYVIDGQGVRHEQAAALGWGERKKGEKEDRYFYLVAFSGVTSASKEFTLFWPGNSGIRLPEPSQ